MDIAKCPLVGIAPGWKPLTQTKSAVLWGLSCDTGAADLRRLVADVRAPFIQLSLLRDTHVAPPRRGAGGLALTTSTSQEEMEGTISSGHGHAPRRSQSCSQHGVVFSNAV